LYGAFRQYGRNLGSTPWGWPGGAGELEATYLFTMKEGVLLLGPQELGNRWWLGIDLRDTYPEGQLVPIFEFNIPQRPTRNLSTIFSQRENLIVALHKGKFTVGRGSLSSDTFFSYYANNPSSWPVLTDEGVQYLILFTFDLDHFNYSQFFSFLSTLTSFADYITWYKDEYRQYHH
ncbi:unnamed protein product, partial [marine sediment metagenome]